MKMIWVALALIVFGTISLACGFFRSFTSNQILGQYTYLHQTLHTGILNRQIPIWISQDFGEADKVEIAKAVEQWNFVLNGWVHLEIIDTHFNMSLADIQQAVKQNGWIIQPILGDNSMVPQDTIDPKTGGVIWTLAFVNQVGGNYMYIIRERLQSPDIFGIAMHEMGHLLGAKHVGDRLMYYHYTQFRYQCVDRITAQAVASYQGLLPDDLNYCVDASSIDDVKQTSSGVAVEVSNPPP